MKIDSNFEGDWNDICEFCGKPQEEHKIDLGVYEGTHYVHRKPCAPEQEQIKRKWRNRALTIKGFVLFGWVLIPLFIAIVGFANFWVGLLLFIISLAKIAVEYVKLFGNADKWIPGHKERMEKERKMKHYYYHCEKNPDGFRKIFIENLADEEKDV
jgi:hypothetical protein